MATENFISQEELDALLKGVHGIDDDEYEPLAKRHERIAHTEELTLRDYFAGLAMQSMLINDSTKRYKYPEQNTIPKYAYEIADAMLEARNKK